jgi:hypothetical protein
MENEFQTLEANDRQLRGEDPENRIFARFFKNSFAVLYYTN